MYTIYADDKLLFSSGNVDDEHILISPKLSLDVNGAGSLTFVMPPGHALYDDIRKLKSIITVVENGKTIFRGRAVDDTADFYRQKNVYCEGDRSFLLDSLHKPCSYSGSVKAYFRQLVSNHNDQVDKEKRFVAGTITAVDSDQTMEVEDDAYESTSGRMEDRLLGAYGGYLMTRTDGDTTYLDWLKKPGGENGTIEFSVNMLDLTDKIDASETFTILLPLGASQVDDDGSYKDPVGIASVNDGVEYIQDDDAIEKYGKIWRVQTWSYEDDPAKLLKKAKEFLKTGAALQTLTLKAVDINFMDGDVQAIHVGDKVHIKSSPHGLDIFMHCAQMSIDLLNPENTTYTFGEPPRTLTENYIQTEEDVSTVTGRRGGGGGGGSVEDLKAKLTWAEINVQEEKAKIDLLAWDVNELTGRTSSAEIRIDGMEASILLKADRELVNDLETRVTSAEIAIDGANANILLKADSTIVDSLGNRMASAELEIDGLNGEISLKADKVTIDAELTSIKKYFAGSATVAKMVVTNLSALSLTVGGNKCEWDSKTVVTDVSASLKYMDSFNVVINADTGATRAVRIANGVTVTPETDTIYFLSW